MHTNTNTVYLSEAVLKQSTRTVHTNTNTLYLSETVLRHPTRTEHTNTNTFVFVSICVKGSAGHPTKTVHTRCPRKKRVNPSLGRMQRIHLGTEVDTIGYSCVPEKNHLKTAGEPVQYLGRMQRILFGTAGYSWVLESRYCA